ncbi:terminase small subunit [Salmonella enterica subsp. enterica serovar Kentucky]|uniref:terminase small subunit n=1 Tax=Escherichia coli TaxID=562 RepID=UPI0028FC286A|nr:terminase small subunit [Escherichia coli]
MGSTRCTIHRAHFVNVAHADEDFCGVTTRAEQVIYDQKFSGAAADLLNANIIARDFWYG